MAASVMVANVCASMRPPHCAGEIVGEAHLGSRPIDLASMRPPHCAGEIALPAGDDQAAFRLASMRPPHCAGEIRPWAPNVQPGCWLQ